MQSNVIASGIDGQLRVIGTASGKGEATRLVWDLSPDTYATFGGYVWNHTTKTWEDPELTDDELTALFADAEGDDDLTDAELEALFAE